VEILTPLDIKDIQIVQNLAREIWDEHYSSILSQDQIDYMLDLFYSKKAIENDIKAGITWDILWYDEIPVGYISCKIEPKKVHLSKIYLKAEMRGKGLGKFMLNRAFQITESKNINYIYLNVNKNNQNSIQFYLNNGFKINNEGIFDIGKGYVMDDFIMEKSISK
jgi:ribosomal protein S18 acetylase RimI-like enzyme